MTTALPVASKRKERNDWSSWLRTASSRVLPRLRAALADPFRTLGFVVLLLATFRLVRFVVAYQHLQMDADEAVHARDGQDYAQAFRSLFRELSASDLIGLFHRPQWHPPAHGIALGTWFGLFGSSIATVRLYSSFCYLLLGLAIFRGAHDLCENTRSRLAFFPLLLFAIDSRQLGLAGMSMLEVPSELLTVVALLLFVRATKRVGRAMLVAHCVATLVALLVFFTRYQHGVTLLVTFAVVHAFGFFAGLRAKDAWRPRAAVAFATLSTIALVVWLFGFGQLEWLLGYSRAQPAGANLEPISHVLFYPKLLATKTPFGALVLATFLAALGVCVVKRRLTPGHGIYLVYLAVALAVLFRVPQESARFGALLAPPLWIVTAGLADRLFGRVFGALHFAPALGIAGATTLVAALLYLEKPFPSAYGTVGRGTARMYRAVARTIEPWARAHTDVVLLGRNDLRSAQALAFQLISECDRRGKPCRVTARDEKDLARGWPRESLPKSGYAARLRDALRETDFVVGYGKTPDPRDRRPLMLKYDFEVRRTAGGRAARITATVHGRRDSLDL